MYTNNRSVAEGLVKKLETVGISVPAQRIIQVGAGIGSHIGPDACGLVYVAAK
jgi:fatty acid-binding protein DegV